MSEPPEMPALCCDGCLPTHRADWEVRPNPSLLGGNERLGCAFCGSARPRSLLTVACPVAGAHRAAWDRTA